MVSKEESQQYTVLALLLIPKALSVGHNAITPVEELVENGLLVALGTDNINDIYKPYCNGDMMTELRVMLEATHFYDMDELVKIATINGKKIIS